MEVKGMKNFINGEDEMDYRLYVLAELSYAKAHPGIDHDDLFPDWWYGIRSYHRRIEIIAEALRKGIAVEETEKLRELMEGSRF